MTASDGVARRMKRSSMSTSNTAAEAAAPLYCDRWRRLGRSEASVRMRLANVRAVVEGGGLGNVAKQTRDVAKAKGLV